MFDLPAYLERIGLAGSDEPKLAELHRAHVTAIPFENLDPRRGVAPSLAVEDLERKLVRGRRGGYCFEHNLLFAAALRALGATVEPLLGRVVVGGARPRDRPRTHLALRVDWHGERWHADVGFGRGTLLEPIPFARPGRVFEQLGWRFRTLTDGVRLILQASEADGWSDQYVLDPEPAPMIDIETSNWFAGAHPSSQFVTGLLVAGVEPGGTRVSLSDFDQLRLAEMTPERTVAIAVEREQIPGLLAERFGLPGFELGPSGRLHPAGAPVDTRGPVGGASRPRENRPLGDSPQAGASQPRHVFLGAAVSDLEAALAFYERLFARPADVHPHPGEAMWQLAGDGWVYVVRDPPRAGRALLTLLFDDLDPVLAGLAENRIDHGPVELAPGRFRRVIVHDPDGNRVSLGQSLAL